MNSFFGQVKNSFSDNPKDNLEKLGVNTGKSKDGGAWIGGVCQLCSDTSGSAGYSREGFLTCHQCGQKKDLFNWYAEREGGSSWEACQNIGAILGLDLSMPRKRQSRMPARMTPEALKLSVHGLWTLDVAKGCREFLAKRKLDDPQMLEQLGVGFINGALIIAQYWPSGELRECYRIYTPGSPQPWTWRGSRGQGATGFWPALPAIPEGTKIMVLEGEWDVMTAWVRLRLHENGWLATTWTGGAGAPIANSQIPKSWRGSEIHVCYDNDTFQGADWDDYWAPNPKKTIEMQFRRRNLIEGVVQTFASEKCTVFLRTVPIDPRDHFGADFRDWVDGGGRAIDDLPSISFDDIKLQTEPLVDAELDEVFNLAGRRVKFTGDVSTVDETALAIPQISKLDCAMGSLPECQRCLAPVLFPDRVIFFDRYQGDLVEGLRNEDLSRFFLKSTIGKPNACPHARLIHEKYETGYKWTAVGNALDASNSELVIISREKPSLAATVEVEGTAYMAGKNVVVMADKINMQDDVEANVEPFLDKLMACTPCRTNKVEDIDDYVHERASDLANNVTNIYGREDIHIAHDLLAHSALWMTINGHKTRAWLDISVMGPTRSGKTKTFEHLFAYHGMGEIQTCLNNISRAGLTMGATSSSKDGSKLKAGLFPRMHRRMLIIDEAHNMVGNSANSENPILNLQQARDTGLVGGVKIYGAKKLNASVRFGTIGNFAKGKRETFQHAAEHLLWLYGAPESLSRLDFGLIVEGDPTESTQIKVPHIWGRDMQRCLILRSWSQTEDQILIDPKASRLADEYCKEWGETYCQDIPLFSGQEKALSILRVAIAVANLTFSHPEGDVYSVEVRKCHVEWAAKWIEHTYELSGYDRYSQLEFSQAEIIHWWRVDKLIMVEFNLSQADWALRTLKNLYGGFNKSSLGTMLGKEPWLVDKWLGHAVREGFIKIAKKGFATEYKVTDSGHVILANLTLLAEEFPGEWAKRYLALCNTPGDVRPHNLLASNLTRSQLSYEWEKSEQLNAPDNIVDFSDDEAHSV